MRWYDNNTIVLWPVVIVVLLICSLGCSMIEELEMEEPESNMTMEEQQIQWQREQKEKGLR